MYQVNGLSCKRVLCPRKNPTFVILMTISVSIESTFHPSHHLSIKTHHFLHKEQSNRHSIFGIIFTNYYFYRLTATCEKWFYYHIFNASYFEKFFPQSRHHFHKKFKKHYDRDSIMQNFKVKKALYAG